MIETVAVTRYVTPLREGGSLPGLVEGDDLGTYVCKFRGAGQGVRVLVAEVIVSGLATRLGLQTPRLVALDLDPEIARYEADEEVQDLLNASPGLNLGIDFLPGAFGFEGEAATPADTAARVLWLDAFTANVDRTWRNPNLLLWHEDLWVIDHGASLYFHHGWSGGVGDPSRFAAQPWGLGDHVFGAHVDHLAATDAARRPDRRRPRGRGGRGARRLARAGAGHRLTRRPARGVRRFPHRPPRDPHLAARDERRMSARSLSYQYVVLRCVPRVDREEFLNVGVVLYCEETAFLQAAWHVDRERLAALDPRLDLEAVCDGLAFVEGVCRGDARAGAAAGTPAGTRFGFLKAPRSTVLQTSAVHGGVTADPARQLEHLLERLVG